MDGGLHPDAAVVVAVPFAVQLHELHAGGVGLHVEFVGEQGGAPGNVGLDAALRRRLGDLVAEIVHVRHRGGAEAQALGDGQQARRLHRPGVETVLPGKNVVVEPGAQIIAVGKAPQDGHGQMGMAVDEARHEHHAGAVDDLFRLLLRGAQADVADFPVGNAHKGVGIDVHLRVHGDAGHVGKQYVHSCSYQWFRGPGTPCAAGTNPAPSPARWARWRAGPPGSGPPAPAGAHPGAAAHTSA